MAFTVDDFHDLVNLLAQRPEWRAELRRLVLSDELLALPSVVEQLVQGIAELRSTVNALVEAQARTDERLVALAEAQERTEGRLGRVEVQVGELVTSQGRIEGQIAELTMGQDRLRDEVGTLRGVELERRYRDNVGAYFAGVLRRAVALPKQEVTDLLDAAEDAGRVTSEERQDVLLADLVVRGRRRDDGQEQYLVVEVSVGIGPSDVERAVRRAALFGRLHPALPVVAGERLLPDAAEVARDRGVWCFLGGRAIAPAEQ